MTHAPACTIIAEAGVNHNGSAELAFRLVDAAVEAGAHVVKFQTFKAEKLVTKDAPQAAYQKRNIGEDSGQFAMLKKLELDDEVFRDLIRYCEKKGIGFLSTPFDEDSARFLVEAGMTSFKVSSGDLTNLPFLRALADYRLPMILSSGMATLAELDESVGALEKAGLSIDKLTLLHCTTEYPAPPGEVNLKAMQTIAAAYPGATIGYSDHTEGIHIPVAAAAMGAAVLEKHFTLDRAMEGPDHKASLEPGELKAMVDAVRIVTEALGTGRKAPTASELPNRLVARKSIVARRDIAAGELLSAENLVARRPGDGISPMRWDDLIGTRATRDYKANEKI